MELRKRFWLSFSASWITVVNDDYSLNAVAVAAIAQTLSFILATCWKVKTKKGERKLWKLYNFHRYLPYSCSPCWVNLGLGKLMFISVQFVFYYSIAFRHLKWPGKTHGRKGSIVIKIMFYPFLIYVGRSPLFMFLPSLLSLLPKQNLLMMLLHFFLFSPYCELVYVVNIGCTCSSGTKDISTMWFRKNKRKESRKNFSIPFPTS